jgi:hypothetical protein
MGVHHQTVQRCVERALAYGPIAALDDRPRPGNTVSICESHRVGDRIRQEHVMSLGSIPVTMTEKERVWFWRRIDERMQRGSNRIDWPAILAQLEARIPRVDAERQTTIELNHLKERKQAAENLARALGEPRGLVDEVASIDGRIAELSQVRPDAK